MCEMAVTNEYLLRAILEIIDKSASLEEVKEAVTRILNDSK